MRPTGPDPAWIPWPRSVEITAGAPLRLAPSGRICARDPLLLPTAAVLAEEILQTTGLVVDVVEDEHRSGDIVLRLDAARDPGYALRVADLAEVTGSDLGMVAAGTVTLLQAIGGTGVAAELPRLQVEDVPRSSYRGVMIDCARHPQPLSVLRQVVQLCRFYKLGHLHLHLTDDEAFTFPSRMHPGVATPGRSYDRAELEGLERFARARGIAVVPELDVPGHSAALVRAMPEVFGLAGGAHSSLLNMGCEAAYRVLDDLIGEMCGVFRSSPYFHIGGDEVDLTGVGADPEVRAYMRQHRLAAPRDLYHHFLRRMRDCVVRHGRRALVWEGFRPGAEAVPEDLVVLAWDTSYHRPDELLARGHAIVNASWQPLYVVGGGKRDGSARKWDPERIHAWNMFRWEHFEERAPSRVGLQLEPTDGVLGGQMCVWEQRASTVVADLRPRVPVFAERIWCPDHMVAWGDLQARFLRADATLAAILA